MSPGPGWLAEPEHDEPVALGQLLDEWAAGQDHAKIHETTEGDH